MTTYLLGVQWENSTMRLALVRRANSGKTTLVRVDTLPAQSFKEWIRQHIPSKSTVSAVLTVPESHIILKELELPVLKGQELAEAVHWELIDKSSIDAESATTWQVVEKRDDTLRVAAMIMKKTEIAQALSFFSDNGVELTAIEPLSISAARIVTIPGATSILLTFDGAEVSAVFVRARVPVFSTSFTIPLTDAAIDAKHFSRDAAAALVSQLKRVISYWSAKEVKIGSIIVVGEAAGFTGLKSDVARGLPIPLTIGQVKPGMSIVYAAPIGAAYRAAGDDTVNFLPKENRISLEKKAFSDFLRRRLWKVAKINVVMFLLVAFLSGLLWMADMTNTRNIAQTQRFVDNHPAQKYVAHITSINGLIKDVATLMAGQEDTGARLRYISSVTPPTVHFTALKMVGGTREEWLVTGTGGRRDILALYYKLKTDGTVGEVSMPYSNFDSETDSLFTVTIVW